MTCKLSSHDQIGGMMYEMKLCVGLNKLRHTDK